MPKGSKYLYNVDVEDGFVIISADTIDVSLLTFASCCSGSYIVGKLMYDFQQGSSKFSFSMIPGIFGVVAMSYCTFVGCNILRTFFFTKIIKNWCFYKKNIEISGI